ncbi:hypothetical protein BX600DRAFT_510401 [Xylariales sp. PMI_506]|nr:hypothetical protein BX600DRAFT_510401 [Xylariales sp. PMI_506]
MAFYCGNAALNCSTNVLRGDPGIAGLGMIICFSASCALTTAFVVLFYSTGPWEAVFTTPVEKQLGSWLINRGVLKNRSPTDRSPRWREIYRPLILGLSDTQLLTGFAIMIVTLKKCDISTYHVTLVSDMAWFASGTHLSALSNFGEYLAQYPRVRTARLILVMSMGVMLFVLTVLQGNKHWFDSPATPARCLFARVTIEEIGGDPEFFMVAQCVLLFLGYFSTAIGMFPHQQEELGEWSAKVGRGLLLAITRQIMKIPRAFSNQEPIGKKLVFITLAAFLWIPMISVLWIMRIIFGLLLELVTGTASGVILDIGWTIYGIVSITTDLAWGQDYMNPDQLDFERSWDFGQIAAVLLLFAPLWVLWSFNTRTEDEDELKTAN